MKSKKHKIIIHYKKLGRSSAHGLAYKDDREIHIDSRLKGIELLETLIHEIAHCQQPRLPEITIEAYAKEMAALLWEQGYRKSDL